MLRKGSLQCRRCLCAIAPRLSSMVKNRSAAAVPMTCLIPLGQSISMNAEEPDRSANNNRTVAITAAIRKGRRSRHVTPEVAIDRRDTDLHPSPAWASVVSCCSRMPLKNTARSWQPARKLLGRAPTTCCMYSMDFQLELNVNEAKRLWRTLTSAASTIVDHKSVNTASTSVCATPGATREFAEPSDGTA